MITQKVSRSISENKKNVLPNRFQKSIDLKQSLKCINLAVILTGLFISPSYAVVEIEFRSFSAAAAIGPPADAYSVKLEEVTTRIFGKAEAVKFSKFTPTPNVPAEFEGSIIAAVGVGADEGGFDAAYVPGASLNDVWGFIYTSGVPFGPTFDEYLGFLFGNSIDEGGRSGLDLLQETLDQRGKNVVVIPIVGSSEQGSGYFMKPVGDVCYDKRHDKKNNLKNCKKTFKNKIIEAGIGLSGLCQQDWTFRYLPPAQNVLDLACNNLVAKGAIPVKNIDFVISVPGAQVFEQMIAGEIQAFELATPLDDISVLFSSPLGNPGTVGARFLHYPGWHQPFLINYMIVNKQVWGALTEAQRSLITITGRDHVLSSYGENMQQQGKKLQEILNVNKNDSDELNDIVLVRWPDSDLALLKNATIEHLNALKIDNTLSKEDRVDYERILDAFKEYIRSNNGYWEVRAVPSTSRFKGWEGWVDSESREDWGYIFE